MSLADNIVNVNISLASAGIQAPGFGIALILGSTPPTWSGYFKSYSSAESLLSDGYTESSPEYLQAEELTEQSLTPPVFYVGKRASPIAQQDTFQVNSLTGVPGHIYEFVFSSSIVPSTTISYTSQSGDSYGQVLAGLLAAFNTAFPSSPPATGAISGSGSSTTLTFTASHPGNALTYADIDSQLTHANSVLNRGIVGDLTNIINAPNGNLWYALALCSNNKNDIGDAAAFIETLKKIYIASSGDSDIDSSSSTDIASILMGKSYNRTGLMYSPANFSNGIESGWMGGMLPTTPGSSIWAYQNIQGATADQYNANSILTLIGNPQAPSTGKQVNLYTKVATASVTLPGWMCSGRFIDVQIGVDWLEANIQTAVLNLFIQSAQLKTKIPYTDQGTGLIVQGITQVIQQGIANGLIDGSAGYSVTVPIVSSLPSTTPATRNLPGVAFKCRFAGAVQSTQINGLVTQ